MNKPIKQKLCWNCEGSVAQHIENCPYCGVYLSPESSEESKGFNLLKPPYPLYPSKEPPKVPKAPYAPKEEVQVEEEPLQKSKEENSKKTNSPDILEALIPLVMLTSGVVFFLFSLVLYLFSSEGVLTLQWNANYWFIYGLIALPCLIIGWKTLSGLKEEVEERQEEL